MVFNIPEHKKRAESFLLHNSARSWSVCSWFLTNFLIKLNLSSYECGCFAYIYVRAPHACWCPQRPEEGIRSPRTGESCLPLCGRAGRWTLVLWRWADTALNCRAILPAPAFLRYLCSSFFQLRIQMPCCYFVGDRRNTEIWSHFKYALNRVSQWVPGRCGKFELVCAYLTRWVYHCPRHLLQ